MKEKYILSFVYRKRQGKIENWKMQKEGGGGGGGEGGERVRDKER